MHRFEAFLKILLLLLLFLIVGAPGCQQVSALGLTIYISQGKSWPKTVSITAGGRTLSFPSAWHSAWIHCATCSNHRNHVGFSQTCHLQLLVQKLALTEDDSAEAHGKHFGLFRNRELQQPGFLGGVRGHPGKLKLRCSKKGLPRVRAAYGGSQLTLQIPGGGDVFCGYLHYTD